MDGSSRASTTGARPPQRPFDVAVVIPTLVRDTLPRAVRSVFRQRAAGDIQVLVGIDKVEGDPRVLDGLAAECPANCALTVLDLGYSTSVKHGGVHPGGSGGVLRTVLSYLANSRLVAYLDDDNWWAEDHLRTLREAITGKDWAFSLRWYAEMASSRLLCVDEWESVGPGAGVFARALGGFVDPNCLMIDKVACEPVLRWWSVPLPNDRTAMSEDRNVFAALARGHRWAGTGRATCYYTIRPTDDMHPRRLRWAAGAAGGPAG